MRFASKNISNEYFMRKKMADNVLTKGQRLETSDALRTANGTALTEVRRAEFHTEFGCKVRR